MQQQSKTGEGGKAGLQIHPNHPPLNETEKDADELVHNQADGLPDESAELDIDGLVHEQPAADLTDDLEEVDPDELVHQKAPRK